MTNPPPGLALKFATTTSRRKSRNMETQSANFQRVIDDRSRKKEITQIRRVPRVGLFPGLHGCRGRPGRVSGVAPETGQEEPLEVWMVRNRPLGIAA